MFERVKWVVGVVLWWSGLYGALSLSQLPGDWGHAICGPWGCGPPLQPLIAMHAFWFVLFAPVVGILSYKYASPRVVRAGMFLTAAALLALAVLFIWHMTTWWSPEDHGLRPYFFERYLFTIITLVDVPIVPALLAGIVLWSSDGRKNRPRQSGGVEIQ